MGWSNQGGWRDDGWARPAASGGGGSEGTVLLDVQSSGSFHANPGSLLFNIGPSGAGIGSGPNGTTNLCLIVGLVFGGAASGTSTLTSVVWDTAGGAGATNQTMTLVPGASTTDASVYYLMNPTLGVKILSITWTGANQISVFAASFVGVDQTGGSTSFPNVATNTGTGTNPTVSISTTPTTRKIFGLFESANNFTSVANGTDIAHDNSMNNLTGAASWDAGTATSMTYNCPSGAWQAIAVAIKGA